MKMHVLAIFWMVAVTPLSALPTEHVTDNQRKFFEMEFQAIFSDCLGYTLVGEKPMSLHELPEYEFDKKYKGNLKPEMVSRYLEQVFRNSKNFIFIATGDANYKVIFLIHKPALKKLIETEQEFLNYRLKRQVTVEYIINLVREQKAIDPIAFGVLLGYGQSNSFFYLRRMQIGMYLGKSPNTEFQIFYPQRSSTTQNNFYRINAPEINYVFESFRDEWNWIINNMAPIQKREVPYLFHPICYIAKKGKTTDSIDATHKQARKKMANIFTDKSFTKAVVELADSSKTQKLNTKSK